jgi:hypothetical protein
MPALIPKLTVDVSTLSHLLSPFLQLSSKITFEKDSQYHKGFQPHSANKTYQLSYKTNINKMNKDWGVSHPNLPTRWHNMCIEGVLLLGHSSLTF